MWQRSSASFRIVPHYPLTRINAMAKHSTLTDLDVAIQELIRMASPIMPFEVVDLLSHDGATI